MTKKRFKYRVIKGSRQAHIKDCHTCKSATIDVYDDNIKYFVDKLNEQQSIIDKEKELLKLIANACSFNKEHSVKEILRNEIKGIDTVTYESANAWHDYVLLSEFFEECYGEHWDNE